MGFLDHPVVRNKYAEKVISTGKLPCCFANVPIESLRFMDLDTLDYITVDDIENGMDIQVTDGVDTYEMFNVLDVLIYNDEYLCIESEDLLLFNANINIEVQQQKAEAAFDAHYAKDYLYSNYEKPEKIEVSKESEWHMGVDSSGYYFGERYDED